MHRESTRPGACLLLAALAAGCCAARCSSPSAIRGDCNGEDVALWRTRDGALLSRALPGRASGR